MAFLANDPNQDPNQDPNKQGQGQAGAPGAAGAPADLTVTSGQSGTIGDGAAPGAAASSSPKGTSSGQFTNLQNYVNANVGSDNQLGQAVMGTVAGQAQAADTAGQTFQGAGTKAATDATVTEDPDTLSYLKAAGAGTGDLSKVNQDMFGKQYNASYAGPATAQDVSGYGDTKAAFDKTQDYAKHAASTDIDDRRAVLGDTFGTNGKQYTQGAGTLDSFLLGAGQGGQKALTNIGQSYGDYSGKFDPIKSAVDTATGTAKTTTDQTRTDTRKAAGDAWKGVEGRLDTAATKVGGANTSASSNYQALAKGDPKALKAAGYNDEAIKYMHDQPNFNYGSLVGANKGYSVGDFANKPDVTNYGQLQNLLAGANDPAVAKYTTDQLKSGGTGATVKQGAAAAADNAAKLDALLKSRLATTKQMDDSQVASLNDWYNNDKMDDLAAKLGVSAGDLYTGNHNHVDLHNFLHESAPTSVNNVATADELAKLGGYRKLLGLTNPGVASAMSGPGYSFDKDAFEAAVKAAVPPAEAAQMAAPQVGTLNQIQTAPSDQPIDLNVNPYATKGLGDDTSSSARQSMTSPNQLVNLGDTGSGGTTTNQVRTPSIRDNISSSLPKLLSAILNN